MRLATLLLASISVFAQTAPAPKGSLDKAKMEDYLRHMELWIPQVAVAIDDPKPAASLPGYSTLTVHLSYQGQTKDEHYYISQDGKNLIKGEVFDTTKSPFQGNLDLIKTDLQPSYGAAGAPVVLVVYGDFQCPVCKAEAQIMRTNVTKTFPDNVRVYFKDFPLESIHPWARAASDTGRCIFKQDPQAFWKFHDWICENQESVTVENLNSKVMGWAKDGGVDSIQLGRCVEGKTTDSEVVSNIMEGRSLGVDATPTTFLNGRKLVGNMEWPMLQQLIQMEIEHQAKTHDADEKCCVVNIPKLPTSAAH
jgi:protein-disulfide isomerase